MKEGLLLLAFFKKTNKQTNKQTNKLHVILFSVGTKHPHKA